MLSLSALRAFHAVAEAASLTTAAAGLSRSQPALTLSLSKLEDQAGHRLLERGRAGARMTPAGQIMRFRVARMFAQFEGAVQSAVAGSRAQRAAMLDQVTDAQMRLMASIADQADIESAARVLGITPASLRRTARSLEQALNCAFFDAQSKRTVPTLAGAEFARRIKLGLREIDSALDEMAIMQGRVESRIAIGMVPLCATRILTMAINDLLEAFPSAQVHIAHGPYLPLLQDLRFGRIDVLYGVLRRPAWATDVSELPLFYDSYAIAARNGHPLAGARQIVLKDLARYDWVAPPKGTPRRDSIEKLFAGSSEKPRVAIETSSLNMQRALLMASDRITLLTVQEMKQELMIGALDMLDIDPTITRRHDGIAMREDWRPTPVQQRFIDILREKSMQLQPVSTDSSRNVCLESSASPQTH